MTTTLTRPETGQPVVESAPNRSAIAFLVAAAALATAILVFQVASSPVVDGSHDVAEFGRQTALAPVDDSHITAEHSRLTALGVAIDQSHQTAETVRMSRLAPVVDDSFERNEAGRQAALAGG
ncbi:MAG TPA: hypothetical protein VLB67_13285 [Acidimicrobiia bacterium]|nr:hypothetical protein [Acidimicrobiia bacterium]